MKKAITYLQKKDAKFSTIIKTYGVPTMPLRPPGFKTLVLLILEQQVSIDSAKATFQKLQLSIKNITPSNIIATSDDELRSVGISRQKRTYLKALATAIIKKEVVLDELHQYDPVEIRKQLIKIKGIGNWTIDIYLIFCLQHPDIMPLGDIAVVNTIKELWDIHDTDGMQQLTQQWQPYRSVATVLLWHHYLSKRNRKVVY
ncbi:DNA-3-methyladenine glycosylase family protein [Ferruginibacter yonginensis]|uniref:DNA-3-methyladenine glycosylase II n=1 Tax=Ferruginibacter yonginensis TaxID=1310416 RepID=A0ABV8QX20_9BACT